MENADVEIRIPDFLSESRSVRDATNRMGVWLEKQIEKSSLEDDVKSRLQKNLLELYTKKANIMLVGAVGCGKSSTINALFACQKEDDGTGRLKVEEMAGVGMRAAPKTKHIERYSVGNLVLWDTPGLEGIASDDGESEHMIRNLLQEKNEDGAALIDLVLVIVDGSSRDLGTTYRIINDVILPEINGDERRILVAMNQADMAMKTGAHWDYDKNRPDPALKEYLKEKITFIAARIRENTGLTIRPIYYAAGFIGGEGNARPYNLALLLLMILESIPKEKRIAVVKNVNKSARNFIDNDSGSYRSKVGASIAKTFDSCVLDAMESGAEVGHSILGIPGMLVGGLIGGTVGCIQGIFDDLL